MPSLKEINDIAKTVTNVKKAAAPPKKKAAKKTTTAKKTAAPKTTAAKAPKAAAAPTAPVIDVVATLRLIEADVKAKSDAKTTKQFDEFTSLTMKSKPNRKVGEKLMDMMGLLSDASAEIKKLLV